MTGTRDRLGAKIAAARTRLILDHPFIGTLTLHLRPVAADPRHCPAIGTDGVHLLFNPGFVDSATPADLRFWVAHEALHCALGHVARRGHRLRARWDVACDHAVNHLLREDGLEMPAGVCCDPAFHGLSAEEIYPLVPDADAPRDIDSHVFDRPGDGGLSGHLGAMRLGAPATIGSEAGATGSPGADGTAAHEDAWDDAGHEARRQRPAGASSVDVVLPATMADMEQAWRSRLATAAQSAREAGRLGQSWQRVLETLLEPTLPWRALLARFVVLAAREDYTFQRPPRREGTAVLPRLARGSLRIVAVVDTSGSITADELNEFTGELDALKAQVQAELTVHACDERLTPEGPWRFDPWEPVRLPASLEGGGGTRFTPAFEWIESAGLAPDLLIYFTDAQGEFPALAPPYPVLWLVKGRAGVPFGERVQLN